MTTSTTDNFASEFIVTDRHGKPWDLTLTLGGARRVDSSDFSAVTAAEFSLVNPGENDHKVILNDVLGHRGVAMAVVWALVQPQVKENLGIDPRTEYDAAEEAFLDSWSGLEFRNAHYTFWRALANFFPDQAIVLLRALDERIRLIEMQEQAVEAEIPQMRQQINLQMEQLLKQSREAFARDLGATSG